MKNIKLVMIAIITLLLASCSNIMSVKEYHLDGDGIDSCKIDFITDEGFVNCRKIIDEYFNEDEIKVLNKRVKSIYFVEKDERWFGSTVWFRLKQADEGNLYVADIQLNKAEFRKAYASDESDAMYYMYEVTLIHELCHLIYSDPEAPVAEESEKAIVSRKGHNHEWYDSFKNKVFKFIEDNNMQLYRAYAALAKYGYEDFNGKEYNYIPGHRSVSHFDFDIDCCCGGVHYSD